MTRPELARAWRIAVASASLELRLVLRDPLAIAFATLWPLVLLLALGFAAPERRVHASLLVHVSAEVDEAAPWLDDALLARGRVDLVDDPLGQPHGAQDVWTITLEDVGRTRTSIAASSTPLTVSGYGGPPGAREWLEDRLELVLLADDPRSRHAELESRPFVVHRDGPPADNEGLGATTAWRHALTIALLWSVMVSAVNVAAGFGIERRDGTWTRLRVAAAPPSLLVAARLACVVALAVPLAVPLLAVGLLLGAPLEVLPCVVTALPIASLGLGALVVSVVGWAPRSRAGQGLAWAVVLGLALLGGAMVPRSLMPPWLSAWADVSPIAWIAVTLGEPAPSGSGLGYAVAWVGLMAFTLVFVLLALSSVGRDEP